MGKLIGDVDDAQTLYIKYNEVEKILERKDLSTDTLKCLKKYIQGRDIIDKSGFSGYSTILVPGDSNNSYVIKFSEEKGQLRSDKEILSLLSQYGYTSKVLDYIEDKEDILITEFIDKPTTKEKFLKAGELSEYMGKTLRKFHDTKWDLSKFTKEQIDCLNQNREKMIERILNNKVGMSYIAAYQNDFDYEGMKTYIKEHLEEFQKNETIIHGDCSGTNFFYNEEGKPLMIDVTTTAFGDRHYDIYWGMWTANMYSNVLTDPELSKKCENIFFDSYGRDAIDEKKLTLCKKMNCMYWIEGVPVKYFGGK